MKKCSNSEAINNYCFLNIFDNHNGSYLLLYGKRKNFQNAGGANENKCSIDENKSCSSVIKNHGRVIQVCFSQRGKTPGSRMDIGHNFSNVHRFCSSHYILEKSVYVALKVSLGKCLSRSEVQIGRCQYFIYLEQCMSLW